MANPFVEILLLLKKEIDIKSFTLLKEEMNFLYESLPQYGWYPCFSMPVDLCLELYDEIKSNNHNKIDSLVLDWISDDYKMLKNNILKRYKEREHILSEAFNAHDNGQFNLSVPVFIIQSDGISHDIYNLSLYQRSKNKPHLFEKLQNYDFENFAYKIKYPVVEITPLIKNKKERTTTIDFNRHEIIPGLCFRSKF